MDVVLGDRIEDLVGGGKAEGRRLAPPFGQKVIEEPRVPAHDPHAAAGAFRMAENIGHAEDLRAGKVRRQRRRFEPVAHVVEVGVPPRCLDPVLVLGRPEQQLVIDDRVVPRIHQPIDRFHLLPGRVRLCRPAHLLDALAVLFVDDDVLGLHVRHVVALFAEIVEGLLLHRLQVMDDVGQLELDVLEDLDEVLPPDPFVDQLVLFQDVEVDARVARADAVDLGRGTGRSATAASAGAAHRSRAAAAP